MAIGATWHDHGLLIWGAVEDAAPLAGPALLRDIVGQLTPDALLASAAAEVVVPMRLPARARARGELAITGVSQPADELCVFEVPALRFLPAEAMDLLLSLPAPPAPPPPQPLCADSLRYWQMLARFTARSIRAQRFFPAARRANAHHEASWRIYLNGAEEIERLERFAGAMPPSCRAVVMEDPPEALALVESFMSDGADALIRRAAGSDPFFTRVQTMAKEGTGGGAGGGEAGGGGGGGAGGGGAGPEIRLLAGLIAPDRLIPGEARENDVLVDQAQLWSSRLGGAAPASGWQLQFTLIEPEEDEIAGDETGNATEASETTEQPPGRDDASPWRVSFSLIPLGEGKPVDAEKLWSDASPLSALGRQLPELRAVMLAELARAAAIFEPLQRVLGDAAPLEVRLSSAEAQQFLRQWSAELRAQSFAIDLPAWAGQSARKLSLIMALRPMASGEEGEAEASMRSRGPAAAGGAGGSRMGLDSLLEFDWRISLGQMELTVDEFDSLVRRQTPLVRIRGHWLEIDADSAAAALELIERKKAGQTTLGDAFRAAFASGLSGGSSPAISLSGNAWIRDLLDQLPRLEAEQLAQPGGFHGTLRPYQLRGLQWLAFLNRLGIGGCLADDMGLGKTIQLIALMLHEREVEGQRAEGGEKRPEDRAQRSEGAIQNSEFRIQNFSPTLLFAPTSVVGNWVREIERFAPALKVLLHHGPRRHRGKAFADAARSVDIVISSYALAHRDREDFSRIKWHRLALDEAQRIKNPSAASSMAIRSLQSPRRVALTGTPIENHLSELWSIMDVLNPGLLGSARDFRERFAVPIEKLLDQDRGEHLRRMIRPFVLRRTKKDPEIAGDLPDKIEMKVYCNLTVEQAAMYERATSEMLGQIDAATGIRRRGLILAVLTRLKQICDHPVLIGEDKIQDALLDRRSGKSERLVEMLEEVTEESDSALVFTQYAQMGHVLHRLLAERLPGVGLFYLHGATPQKQRDEMVRAFQETKTPAVFILSLRAGGLGLNLTAASHVFHYDRWWNPAIENQATDRAHRIGQTRQVQVHKFIALGTVEERIDRLLAHKTQLAESIVGAGDEWLTDLSTNELREYLKLSDEAVGEF